MPIMWLFMKLILNYGYCVAKDAKMLLIILNNPALFSITIYSGVIEMGYVF